MEEAKTTQPQEHKMELGTWDKLGTEDVDRKPKIDFEMNKAIEVVFTEDNPTEMPSETGAYYIFQVEQSAEPKVIMTSAWTLLKGLKCLTPLAGKRVRIEKVMEKGRQHFKVTEIK